jgi:hypothetical protein
LKQYRALYFVCKFRSMNNEVAVKHEVGVQGVGVQGVGVQGVGVQGVSGY